MVAWAKKYQIPPDQIFLGEFGVQRDKVDPESRRVWLKTMRVAAEMRNMPWSYWSLEGPEYMGLYSDRDGRALDPLILDALGMEK